MKNDNEKSVLDNIVHETVRELFTNEGEWGKEENRKALLELYDIDYSSEKIYLEKNVFVLWKTCRPLEFTIAAEYINYKKKLQEKE